MLKRLRVKFIALNMLSVFLVVSIALGGVCFIEHQRDRDKAAEVLGGAIGRAAGLDKDPQDAQAGPPANGNEQGLAEGESQDQAPEADGSQDQADAAESAVPHIGGTSERRYAVPVAVYVLAQDGSISPASPATATATVSDDVASQAAAAVADAPDGMGVLGEYGLAYMKRTMGDTVYLSFVDSDIVDQWRSLAFTLALAGVAVLGAFLVIGVFFSRWALRPVEQAWTAQKQFVADASHELKTPLTVILANMSILMKHPEQTVKDQAQWVESTHEEAQRMQELVGDMLALAQAESAEAQQRTRVDLSDLVSKEALQFESVAFERGIDMAEDVADGVAVDGDARKLEKLAGTLIDNACKYAGDGGTVRIALSVEGRKAVLSVRNTGPTIPPEDIEHIFDRFYRADKARTRDNTGSFGLGLAIAREAAESHGGSIRAKSSDAEGTVFTVTLPLAK